MVDRNNNQTIDQQQGKKPEPESLGALTQELAAAKEKMEEYLNGWKRAQADYQNFKKEMDKRQGALVSFIKGSVILEILPIYDNLKLALKHASGARDNWLEGVKQVVKQLEDVLNNNNIEPIKTVGEEFSPECHESVGTKKVENQPAGKIVEEVKSGYKFQGQVLVPAQVIISE